MAANNDLKKSIQTALSNFEGQPLADAARGLLNTLGYQSARTLKITPNTAEGFQAMFGRDKPLKPEARLEDWLSMDLLFQVSEAEIQASLNGQGNFTAAKVDNKDIRSYLFFAVELKDQQYTRTQLSGITREINRLFESIPALIIFKHGGLLSMGIIARRLSKKDNSKDVLEKVTIIKDISFASPHRAHVEILLDLSIGELQSRVGFSNFAELQKAWEQVLDTSALNKKFFREVADWYFWAVDTVKFPKDAETQMSVIRLITRLIFVWFIKEKGLVPPELFDERRLKELLYFNDPQKSSYYKAILQNLFFATLNTEMGEGRKFRSRNKNPNGLDGNHGVTTLYRYEEQFKAPKEALKLFANIPFLNGGLFECLDKSEEKIYIDGFSDTPKNQPSVPDELFFGAERPVDLSAAYGDTRRSHQRVRGLINIFNDYKFTIEENTPIEEEIALDPELLGKVFENLLAAYNPETGSTARKQTGSFYTPREIVNYMVDEALIAYLDSAMSLRDGVLPSTQSPANNEEIASQSTLAMTDHLRHLFTYNNQAPLFNEAETLKLIEAINNLKALDPACGSGAFPMGLLHKLVFVLKKLDPDNTRWREFQISKVADFPELVTRVESAFKDNHDDYGRKLYLIQNCIYGVDIQPIAVQIAKLRVFISLVVEQKVDDSKPNRGIQPLPNLETKFVAANTLIGINRPDTKSADAAPASISPEVEESCNGLIEKLQQYLRSRDANLRAKYITEAQEFADVINAGMGSNFQPLGVDWIFTTAKDTAALKTLLPVKREAKASALVLRNPVIDEKEKQLAEARKRHFSARTPATKTKYREQDKKLRRELADLLKKDGWGSETAQQLASWDPYDQNTHAEFFDAEWMFGIEGGFHVVIANPPWVSLLGKHGIEDNMNSKDIYLSLYEANTYMPNLYDFFLQKGLSVLIKSGHLCYILPDRFGFNESFENLRRRILLENSILQIIYKWDFESIIADTMTILIKRTPLPNHQILIKNRPEEEFLSISQQQVLSTSGCTLRGYKNLATKHLLEEIQEKSFPLKNVAKSTSGFGGKSSKITIKQENKRQIPILKGSSIQRYSVLSHIYFEFKDENLSGRTRDTNKLGQKEKVLLRKTGDTIIAAYDNTGIFPEQSLYFLYDLDSKVEAKFLLGLLNSKLITWYYQNFLVTNLDSTPQLKNYDLDVIPIILPETQKTIVILVAQILAAKRANFAADTRALEAEIDRLVYGLYGLSEEEIGIVEGK